MGADDQVEVQEKEYHTELFLPTSQRLQSSVVALGQSLATC